MGESLLRPRAAPRRAIAGTTAPVHASRLPALAAALLLGVAGSAVAAGGHFAVDSATILEPGECQVETWAAAGHGGGGSWHVGPSCRVGAWELHLNLDGAREPGAAWSHAFASQAKWVTQLSPRWSAGASLLWNTTDGRYTSFQPLGLVTWQAQPQLQVHFNAGRDLPPGGGGTTIAGIAAEWAASRRWSLTAERFNDTDGRAVRIGARWQHDPGFSVDLSQARALGDARGHWWTVGVNWVFSRPRR